jgi:hypothetical protein
VITKTKIYVISVRAKNRMQQIVESKLRVVTLNKEERGRLSGSWIKAVSGKGNIKKKDNTRIKRTSFRNLKM